MTRLTFPGLAVLVLALHPVDSLRRDRVLLYTYLHLAICCPVRLSFLAHVLPGQAVGVTALLLVLGGSLIWHSVRFALASLGHRSLCKV